MVFALTVFVSGIFFAISRFGDSRTSFLIPGKTFSAASVKSSAGESLDVSEEKSDIKILFGGDMMFDRFIRTVIAHHGDGFVFDKMRETLASETVVVANLEGPITENQSVSEKSIMGEAKNYVFTFPSQTAALLKQHNVSIVNLGNNHILNFQAAGVLDTKRLLAEARVSFFGSPLSGDTRTFTRDFDGTKVAFVNYNQFIYQGKEKAFADIADVRGQADIVIVYAHWGVEYAPVQSAIRELAHQFIDSGADAIIGSHPHIVQEKEEYHGKMIYYSLGNFIFDQYFRDDTQTGLCVEMVINQKTKKISWRDIPIILENNGQTRVAP